MRGLISFHPIDVELVDRTILALVRGDKINPQNYLQAALRLRETAWRARRLPAALERTIEEAKAPRPPESGSIWEKVRARLERIDHRSDPIALRIDASFDTDLHFDGRPFFITEGSTERVIAMVDRYLAARGAREIDDLAHEQLRRVDKEIAREVPPDDLAPPTGDLAYRADLLAALKQLHDLGQAARGTVDLSDASPRRRPAAEVLAAELPWRTVSLHACAVPFWVARDVDGLDTVCRSAGLPPPTELTTARKLFGELSLDYPALAESLSTELKGPRDVGAYVPPEDVPGLLEFLNTEGAQIIQVASRHGEGPAAGTLLRKIRECAAYAASRGWGYLEASGVPMLGREDDYGSEYEDEHEAETANV